jgi:carbonic anhydrase
MTDHTARRLLTLLLILSALSVSCQKDPGEGGSVVEGRPANGREALQRLLEGNERFAAGNPTHTHSSVEWRSSLVPGQHPFATILGCSDSRVPPELVFDQGFGDLFIIRVAGNVIGDDEIGSLEYGVEHLETQLIVVMGHEGCGAVTAALAAKEERGMELAGIQRLLKAIDPALADLDTSLSKEEMLLRAVEANVSWSVEQIGRLPEMEGVSEDEVRDVLVVGAVYEMATGKVRLIE